MTTEVEAITLRVEGDVVVGEITRGELKNEREILSLLNKLGGVVEKRSHVQLLLNLSRLEYVSSAGIGAIVRLLKQANRKNGKVKLCCMTGDVLDVFHVMNLTKIFEIYDTEEEGLASFD